MVTSAVSVAIVGKKPCTFQRVLAEPGSSKPIRVLGSSVSSDDCVTSADILNRSLMIINIKDI